MRVRGERGFTLIQLIIIIVILLIIVMIYLDSQGTAPPTVSNPECPSHYEGSQQLALPGPITGVPEYHDCQKLIQPDGTTYGALAGVYARENLASLIIPIVELPLVQASAPPGGGTGITVPAGVFGGLVAPTDSSDRAKIFASAVAVAEIRSWDLPYGTLGITQGLNCLYVVRVRRGPVGTVTHVAFMLNSVTDDQLCLRPVAAPGVASPPAGTIKWLKVSSAGPESGRPYPAVARWDWDATHTKQYVSMLCAPDWCEVGDFDLQPIPVRDVVMTPADEETPWEQKGRYDEQRLAVAGTPGLVPSPVFATAAPHAKIADYNDDSFKRVWAPIAHTVLPAPLPVYKTKFNFGQGTIPGITNTVSLCSGWRFSCLGLFKAVQTLFTLKCWKSEDGKIWWAKIEGSDGSVEYRCVTRRVHVGLEVPPAARWRWKANDEGLWARCSVGCCEVQ